MKYVTILSLVIFVSQCRSSPQKNAGSTPEALAIRVLHSLQSKNAPNFMEHVVTPAEFSQQLESQKPSDNFLKMSKKQMFAEWLSDRAKMPAQFDSVIAEGEKQGINWQDVRFVKAKYTIETDQGLRLLDYLDVYVSHAGKLYVIRLDDCILLQRGWLLLDKIIWKGLVT